MGKLKNKKFYKPGTLPVKGTKVSFKTQPYTNGVLFDTENPIASYHVYLSMVKNIINQYEYFINIPGMNSVLNEMYGGQVTEDNIAKAKLLIDFLAQSPIEIELKEQVVDNEILTALDRGHE